MSHVCNDVSMWLNVLNNNKQESISLFSLEFKRLAKLGPIEPIRVIKNPNGEPRLFFIDRLSTIKLLKELYAFHSKEDLVKELHLES